MKKYIIALLTLSLTAFDITSSNLCWVIQNKSDERLSRKVISYDAQCTCECWKYPHTKGTNNQYKCTNCEHRITPPDPLSKNGPKYKTYYEAGEQSEIEKEIESNPKERPYWKALQVPLNQQWREKSYTNPFLIRGFND